LAALVQVFVNGIASGIEDPGDRDLIANLEAAHDRFR
jgi:hypothetical protein